MNSSKNVPVLITWDVDPDSWVSNDTRINGLNTVRRICKSNGIPATLYVTADGADSIAQSMLELQDSGNEIGCHGLIHGMEEDYDRMPVDLQEQYISLSTQRLEKIIQSPVRSFRSPRVKTSAATLRILGENGYWSDSSVCSQRSDLVSSNLLSRMVGSSTQAVSSVP
jgi:peptidoglycan/xylan/chitin deacetylase (PgdA/CDA1 family)